MDRKEPPFVNYGIVVSSNTNEAYIYFNNGRNWELEHVLGEHDMPITSVDWGEKEGKIVTCSQDRNAYVWNYDEKTNKWKPNLVLLRINRSATCVKFSTSENKFAVGTGAKLISVCYYDKANDWWISRHIKKNIEGTTTSIAWHPLGVLLGATCTDMKVYVFSARVKEIDKTKNSSPWGDDKEFGTLLYCCESDNRSWTHSIDFSPSGNAIAWTSHDSTISYKSVHDKARITQHTKILPFRSIIFISENVIIAAGYDFVLGVYKIYNGEIATLGKLGEYLREKSMKSTTAFKMFKMLDTRAQKDESTNEYENTVHKKTIGSLRHFSITKDSVTHISSTAEDGNLVIWDVSKFINTPTYALA